jgi:hypothetical protein
MTQARGKKQHPLSEPRVTLKARHGLRSAPLDFHEHRLAYKFLETALPTPTCSSPGITERFKLLTLFMLSRLTQRLGCSPRETQAVFSAEG